MANKFNLTKGIGDGLLNDASKASKRADEFKVVPLSIELLDPNEDNEGMSLDNIEELAQSILENGLDQNFVVIPKGDGHYKILTGHRRRLACLKLIEDGHDEWKFVPCLIKNIDKITLPLSDASKEKYALLTTNLERRKNTLSDNMKMLALANEIFDELLANGEDVGQRRKWVAERLGVSDSKVKILDYIEGHSTTSFKLEIEQDRVSPTVANEIAHLPPEEQDELLQEKKAELPTLKAEDVTAWKQEKDIEKKKKEAEAENKHIITSSFYEGTKTTIEAQLTLLENGLEVTHKEYENIMKIQEQIQKSVLKMNDILLRANSRKDKKTLS